MGQHTNKVRKAMQKNSDNNKNIFIYYNDQSINKFLKNSGENIFYFEVNGNY